MQAPWIPGEVHLPRMWQERRLPPQQKVPDLGVVVPPEYLRHDRRLPRKRNPQGPHDDVVDEQSSDQV